MKLEYECVYSIPNYCTTHWVPPPMNVELHTPAKAETFAALFQHIKLFTEHINILFQIDKMFVQGMDSSRVSIFEINLPAAWFDKYELTQDCDVTIGINVNIFSKVLATRDKSQIVRLQLQNPGDDKLFVDYVLPPTTATAEPAAACAKKKTAASYDKSFEVPLLEIESDMLMIPPMESQAEFSVPSVKFATIVDQLKLFGDTIDLECSETAIQLSAKSLDHGKMSVEIPIDDLHSFSINEGESLTLSYSLAHLHNICLYSKIAPEITIYASSDFPIKMVFSLSSSVDVVVSAEARTEAQIVFYLAPKMSDE